MSTGTDPPQHKQKREHRPIFKHRVRRKRKTRNVMLIVACIMVFSYIILDVILGFYSAGTGYAAQFDSTLTSEVFDFAKWLCGGTAAITVVKTLKGRTNSDEDEPPSDGFVPPDA